MHAGSSRCDDRRCEILEGKLLRDRARIGFAIRINILDGTAVADGVARSLATRQSITFSVI